MQKERGYLRQIAEGVLVIGFSVQIVLGLVWIVLHLSLDPLSLGKMLAVFLAAYITLRELGCAERGKCLWGTLVLFTFPMLAQEYFTGSTYALLCAGGLGLLTVWHRGCGKQTHQAWRIWGSGVLLAVLICVLGILQYGMEHDEGERIRPAAMAVSRFAWTDLEEVSHRWPETLRDAVPQSKIRETMFFADNVNRVLVPALEEVYGTDAAGEKQVNHILWMIARAGLSENTKRVAVEILWDLAGNALAPVVFLLQLSGRGYESYSGVLYDLMRQEHPGLSALYMRYSCRWFGAALIFRCILWACGVVERQRLHHEKSDRHSRRQFIPVVLAGVIVLGITLRGAGMMDYRQSLIVTMLWLIWCMGSLLPGKGEK